MIFFLILIVKRSFNRKGFKQKKNMGVQGLFLERWKFCKQNSRKEWKQPPIVILQQANFYDVFIWCLWLRIIRNFDQGV